MSDKQEVIPWEAIAGFLKDKDKSPHCETVREWLGRSNDNKMIFREVLVAWQLTRRLPANYQPDEKLLWKKLMFRTGVKKPLASSFGYFWQKGGVAIALLMAFALGFLFNYLGGRFNNGTNTALCYVKTPLGSRSQVVLPDSTVVWLNSGAEISYSPNFDHFGRHVFVAGECYFEVTKNPHKSFVVHCNNYQVKVYGTAFNVKETKQKSGVEVSLVEGQVEVQDANCSKLSMLKPGEQFCSLGSGGSVTKIDHMEAVVAWKNDLLIFDDEPLCELVKSLESWYGVEISVDPLLCQKHRLTFKVKSESLKEVLDMISLIIPIKYSVNGEIVTILPK